MSLRSVTHNAMSMPQQHYPIHSINRRLQESSFGCPPPDPIQFPIRNATENTTTYLDIPQEVHNVEIIFNYEIRHFSNIKWDRYSDESDGSEEESDSGGGWFSKLFGGRMLSSDTEAGNGTSTILEELESVMVASIWKTALQDPSMEFNSGTDECKGLVVSYENETFADDDVNFEFQAPTYETKLLGLTAYPADEVNIDGK